MATVRFATGWELTQELLKALGIEKMERVRSVVITINYDDVVKIEITQLASEKQMKEVNKVFTTKSIYKAETKDDKKE